MTFATCATLPLHPYWHAWGCCDGQPEGSGSGSVAGGVVRVLPHGVPQSAASVTGRCLRLRHWEAVSSHPVCGGDMGTGACRRCGRWEAIDRTTEHRAFGVTVCPALAGDVDSVVTLLRLHRQHMNALFFDDGGGALRPGLCSCEERLTGAGSLCACVSVRCMIMMYIIIVCVCMCVCVITPVYANCGVGLEMI